MTEVYITKTGVKYHATYSCPSFEDAEQQRGYSIRRWAANLQGCDLQPCNRCWPETAGYDAWTRLEHRVEQEGDSPYEARFVRAVLREVPGLMPDHVALQQHAKGKSGASYFIDFVITPPGGNQLAIEVDGRDKAPGQKSPAQVEEEVQTRRADLIGNGWRMLNFSNTRMSTRPEECVTEIRAELKNALAPRNATVTTAGDGAPRPSPSVGSATRSWTWPVAGAVAVLLIAGGAFAFVQANDLNEPAGRIAPNGQDCPDSAPVEGNRSEEGERIFHEPGWRYYDSTWPEDCFATSTDAQAEGYRESEIH